MEDEKTVFNIKEAARYLGINAYTLLGALHRGEIPYRRVGRRWVISKSLLDEWNRLR